MHCSQRASSWRWLSVGGLLSQASLEAQSTKWYYLFWSLYFPFFFCDSGLGMFPFFYFIGLLVWHLLAVGDDLMWAVLKGFLLLCSFLHLTTSTLVVYGKGLALRIFGFKPRTVVLLNVGAVNESISASLVTW
eukprot:Gb_19323 [translate_table: standard]